MFKRRLNKKIIDKIKLLKYLHQIRSKMMNESTKC